MTAWSAVPLARNPDAGHDSAVQAFGASLVPRWKFLPGQVLEKPLGQRAKTMQPNPV